MKIEKVKSEGMSHEYKVTILADAIESAVTSAVQKRARTLRMNGFRPGRVPLNIVRNTVEGEIVPGILEAMISEACDVAVKESDIAILATKPTYRIDSQYVRNKDLEITVFIDEAPNVEIKPYEFSMTKIVPDVEDEEVEANLQDLMKTAPAYQDATEGYVIKPLDVVRYSATCYVNGVESKNRTFEDSVKLPGSIQGDAAFLGGFVGRVVGESFDFTPPTEDNITYKICITSIQEALTSLTPDEYAEKHGFKDAEELKVALRQRLEDEIRSQAYLYHKNQILEAITDQYNFELPQKIVENERVNVIAEVRRDMEQEKKDNPEAAIEEKTDEELGQEYDDVVRKRVLLGYVLSSIAKREGIVVTDRELQNAIKEEIDMNPSLADAIIEFYSKNEGALVYKQAEIMERKVVSFLLSVASVTEEKKTKKEVDELIEKLLED
ncbi:MAG: trigger factor [Holosporales bacterium]|jgi:trigger factor|nr:trigger factor [Holosporales bacterium]